MNTTPHTIVINGKQLPIFIRKHKRSRHIVLRYHPLHHAIKLTLPRYATIRQGLDFANSKRTWIAKELASHAGSIRFEEGVSIPVLGKEHTIKHIAGRGTVRIDGDYLLVPGDKVFIARRVKDWLKKTAHEVISKAAQEKAKELNVRITKISLRDTSSHWGSCSHSGRLSFSWRVVLAPPEILEYLVSHEVAHVKEHNHSPAFWKEVASICPHWRKSGRWLKAHGSTLYRYTD